MDTLFPADDVGVSILVAGHSELFPRVELISTEVKSEISSFPERPSSKTISSVRIFSLGALVYLSALLAYFLFVRRRKKGSGIPVLENSLLYLAGAAGIPRLQDKIWNQRFSNIAYFGAADIILAEAVAKGPKFKKHYIAAIESLILAGAPQGEVQLILGCIRRLDQNYDSNRLFELSELGKTALTLSEKRTLISKHLG